MVTPERPNHLLTVVARCKSSLIAVALVSLAINLLVLTGTIYMLQIYDRVLTSRSPSTLLYLTLIAIFALLVMAALDIIRSKILVRAGAWIDAMLSPMAYARGIENAVRGSTYRSEALRDLSAVRNFLSSAAIVTLFDAPWTPIYIGFIYLMHPILGHIALAGAIGLFFLAWLTDHSTHAQLRQANQNYVGAMRGVEAVVRNAHVIDAMGMVGTLARRWHQTNADILHKYTHANEITGQLSAIAKFARQGLQVAVLGVGAWLVIDNRMGPGAMVATSIIMGRALAPVEQAIGSWKNVVSVQESWKRLKALFSQPLLHGSGMPLPRPSGAVSLEGVTYAPPGADRAIIKGVTCEIAKGEAVAVVGPSAAGKSTLARLIVGIHQPQGGHIRLDGADMFFRSREHVGRDIGYLPQDVELFPGTVAENISRMEPEADPTAIVEAARLAGAHEMILRLPNGYDTVLTDRGSPLSSGQQQRIGLARAVYGRPALLVLDEPNSNLDSAGEQALNDAIKMMKELGSTIIVVAHRPAIMMNIDKILLLVNGQLQNFGERDEVLQLLQRPAPRQVVKEAHG